MNSKGTILVVDDFADSLRMLTQTLREEGFRVRPADSGVLALAAVEADPPDLILLDIRMPVMDGFEVIKRLKLSEKNRGIPVIFLSATTEPAERIEGLHLGAVDFVSKPFQRAELLARVQTHVELGRLRHRLELEVDKRTKELYKSEERNRRLATAIEQVALDVVITDADGIIQYVNPSVTETLGFSSDELLGRHARVFKSGRHGSHFYEHIWSTIQSGKAWTGRFENRTKDGQLLIQASIISPIRNEQGEISAYVATRKDVTKQVELETRLIQGQKMEAIGTMAGGIAHDFNNILTAISGYTELSLLVCSEPEQREYLNNTLQASTRATELVQQILAFSRSSREEAKPIQPKVIIKEALKLLRASIPSSIEMRNRIDSNSVVMADPAEIHRIIVNLCTNAALAMRDNGGTLDVSLTDVVFDTVYSMDHPELHAGDYLCLTVSDTGCGMTEEVKSRIFEPFFTTREKGEGTGMGLSVVHGIVKTRGGSISVASVLGEGTSFMIYLPIVKSSEVIESALDEAPVPGTERILFVDDEEMLVRLGEFALRRLGYTVVGCTESEEALRRFEATPGDFDVVITDMTMPRMCGDELASRIKSIRPSVPVILCTGYSAKINAEKAKLAGIEALAPKPIGVAALSRLIRKVIEQERDG